MDQRQLVIEVVTLILSTYLTTAFTQFRDSMLEVQVKSVGIEVRQLNQLLLIHVSVYTLYRANIV